MRPAGQCPIPCAEIGILHLAGALNERAEDDGAVGNREARYVVGVKGMWEPGEPEPVPGLGAPRGERVRPFGTGRTYVNFQTDDEPDAGVRASYGANYARLAALKHRYDPANLFRSNRNVAPASAKMRVEAEHRFPVSVRDGFEYITDLGRWPEYWPGLVRVEPGSHWREPGDQTRIVIRLLGREVPLEMTLSRLEPYRLVEYTQRAAGPARRAPRAPLRRDRRRVPLPAGGGVRARAAGLRGRLRPRAGPAGDRSGRRARRSRISKGGSATIRYADGE